MALPKIRKDFKAIIRETPKAILFQDFDGGQIWIPRSLCTLIKRKSDMVIATLAASKFEEITGIEPEPLTTSFATMGGSPLNKHRLDCQLVESASYPLLEGQRKQLEKAVKCRFNYLFWDAGTGKTLAALTLANSYLSAGIVNAVVVLAPAALQYHWLYKAAEYFPTLKIQVLSIEGNSFDTSMPKIVKKYKEIIGNIHLIIDESHFIKNMSAKRTKNIDKHYNAFCVTCLTASAIGKNAADLYYQFSVADRAIIGEENFNSFAKKFLLYGGQDGDRIVAYQNTKELSQRIAPYVFFLKKEDVRPDLPKKHYHKVYYHFEDNQKKAYNAVLGLINQIQAKTKTGFIPREKMYQITSFLQKISCGFVPDEYEIETIFSNLGLIGDAAQNVQKIKDISFNQSNQRLQTVVSITSRIPDQFIIWCTFREELNSYIAHFKDAQPIYGGMSSKHIHCTLADFKAGKFKCIVAMQQMGTGFDIPWVNNAIYSSTTFDYIKRLQSEDRIYRINRSGDCHIHDVIAIGSIDERIHQVLKYKEDIPKIFNGEKNTILEA